MKKILLFSLAATFLSAQSISAQKKKKSKKGKTEQVAPAQKTKKGDIKNYNQVVTKDAITDEGLFKVHKVDKKFLYEIPFNKLDKDMLWVTRIAQIPTGLGGGYMNAGSKTNEQMVHWFVFKTRYY